MDASVDAGRDAGPADGGARFDGGHDAATADAGDAGSGDAGGPSWPTAITRVSVPTAGGEANGSSSFPSISPDGRFVAFRSRATNLVPDDTNEATDVFVHDRATGVTERVSVGADGSEGDGDSLFSAISEDGRFVAFASDATNLVAGDTNGVRDVFVRDRVAGTTERVSVATDGAESDAEPQYVDLSGDGRFVVWASAASTLVADDPNPDVDVFLRDRTAGTTTLVSRAPSVSPVISSTHPRITPDGAHVFFVSGAALTADDTDASGDGYRYATASGELSLLTEGDVPVSLPGPSEDGSLVVFGANDGYGSGDANGATDLYFREIDTPGATRVSVGADGEPDGSSRLGVPLSDGRTVVFVSDATNLVPGVSPPLAARLYVYDLVGEVTTRLDVSASGEGGDSWLESSFFPIDVAGRSVVFASRSTNLVPGDGNGSFDIFVLDVPAP
jgi:Tol biopolymer transport system component